MPTLVTVFRIPKNYRSEEDKKIDALKVNVIHQSKYDTIPTEFESLHKWPIECNLCCIHCGCTSRRRPFFIPQRITVDGKIVRGNNPVTCSPQCAIAYINSRDIGNNRDNFKRNVLEFTGLNELIVINASPEAKKIIKYGGHIPDEAYQYSIYVNNKVIIEKLYHTRKILMSELERISDATYVDLS